MRGAAHRVTSRRGCRGRDRKLARAAHELVRSVSPRLRDDRPLADDIEAVAASIRDGSALVAIEAEAGELQ